MLTTQELDYRLGRCNIQGVKVDLISKKHIFSRKVTSTCLSSMIHRNVSISFNGLGVSFQLRDLTLEDLGNSWFKETQTLSRINRPDVIRRHSNKNSGLHKLSWAVILIVVQGCLQSSKLADEKEKENKINIRVTFNLTPSDLVNEPPRNVKNQ